jgi:hypothetical protein
LIGIANISKGRKRAHPERVEAIEIEMDEALPGQAPVLRFHHRGQDPRRVIATIPDLERHHMLYIGRLVSVELGADQRRKGSIEEINGNQASVRYVDWDD